MPRVHIMCVNPRKKTLGIIERCYLSEQNAGNIEHFVFTLGYLNLALFDSKSIKDTEIAGLNIKLSF